MFKEEKIQTLLEMTLRSCNHAILISRYQHLQSSALISKTEPKTLKTPLQEHQKELETQPFERSHVDNLAILQS